MAKTIATMGYGIAALVLLASCAGRVPTQVPMTAIQPMNQTNGYTAPAAAPTSSYSTTAPGNTSSTVTPAMGGVNSAYGTQNVTAPGAQTYGATGVVAQGITPMSAKIDSKKNGVFLGLGKFKVTVSVTNPATTPQAGTLKVSILDKGKAIKDFTERLTVPAGQTVTRTYEDKRWKADNASVSITPDTTSGDPYAAYGTP